MIEFNEMEGKSSLYETLRSVQSQEKSALRITSESTNLAWRRIRQIYKMLWYL